MNSPHWRTTREGVKSYTMDKGERLSRGLEEISSLFLSSANYDHSAETLPSPAPAPSPSITPLLFPVFCCLPPSPAHHSFFVCNLSVEIAKRNHTVTVIDFECERSAMRHLMGCTVRDGFPSEDTSHPDYKVESLKINGLPEITLVFPAMPQMRGLLNRTVERILAQEKVRKCDVILINSPIGPDRIAIPENFTRFQRAVFLMDDQAHSLVKVYSWVKRLSSGCRSYLIGAVFGESEDSDPVWQNISKLQKTVFKNLPIGLQLRVVAMPLDREAKNSIQSKKPLALMESSTSSSAKAIDKLCESLLGKE